MKGRQLRFSQLPNFSMLLTESKDIGHSDVVDQIARSLNCTSEVISNTKSDIAVINTKLV